MGVPGLWKLVEPVAEKQSFQRFCIEEGFIRNEAMNGRGLRGLRVGIDALDWAYHAAMPTKNAELAILHSRCCHLLCLPLVPLFMFDSPDGLKRRQGNLAELEQDFKHMLDAFGFPWQNASGGAEPELASLTRRGFLDAIFSEDSDMLIFGATTIIRMARDVPESELTEQAVVYRTDDIENHPDLLLTRADLSLIALLVGGDYSEGIKDCGIATAVGLARAGYGHDLARIARRHSGEALRMRLGPWRTALCREATTNSSTLLPRKCPALARNMPPDFPCTGTLLAYFQPSVSSNTPPCLYGKLPSPMSLARFARDHFRWGHLFGILNQFSNSIFPGLALRVLIAIVRAHDLGIPSPLTPTIVGEEISTPQRNSLQKCEDLLESYMRLNIPRQMIYEIAAAVGGDNETKLESWVSRELPKLRVWVPLAVKDAVGGLG